MRDVTNRSGGRVRVLLTLLLTGLACPHVQAAVTVLGVQYQQDELFPEFDCIWDDKDYPTSCFRTYLGVDLHGYLKNSRLGNLLRARCSRPRGTTPPAGIGLQGPSRPLEHADRPSRSAATSKAPERAHPSDLSHLSSFRTQGMAAAQAKGVGSHQRAPRGA